MSYPDIHTVERAALWGNREELMTLLGGMVGALAHKHRHAARKRGLEQEDLEQEARRAILECLTRWSPAKSRFRSYAYQTARFAILDLLNASSGFTINTTIAVLAGPVIDGRKSAEEQAEKSAYSRTAIAAAAHALDSRNFSRTTHVNGRPEPYPLDSLPAERDGDLEARDAAERILSLAERELSARQFAALLSRAGLSEYAQGDLAAMWGVSRQAVNQQAGLARWRMRELLEVA